MKNLFAGLLPPGWTAQQLGDPRVYAVHDDRGSPVESLLVESLLVDSVIPLEKHVRNLWWVYTFPDAPPSIYLRWVGHDHGWDWLPFGLTPVGVRSLEDIGSLGR